MSKVIPIQDANKKLTWALRYAARGFGVFPVHYPIDGNCSCGNRGECAVNIRGRAKHPMALLAPKGKTNAVTDAETIRRWWQIAPNANFGAVPPRNCTILDVDGALGMKTFTELSEKHGEPLGPIVRTSRGFHVYCQFRADLANTAGVWPGIDVRNYNGYVLGIGSQHISEQFYEEDATSSFDTPFGACLWPVANRREHGGDAGAGAGSPGGDGERRIEEGHRDSELIIIGGHLRNLGMSSEMLFKGLTVFDEAWCKPPLGVFGVAKLAKSLSKYPIHPPRISPVKLEINADGEINNEWVLRLNYGGKKLLPNYHNIETILTNDADYAGTISLDEFAQRLMMNGREFSDVDATAACAWFNRKWAVQPTPVAVHAVAAKIASGNKYNPVRSWLDGLAWDGQNRLEHFAGDAFDVTSSAYSMAVSKNFFIQAVARIYRPGCKADCMLVLEGDQGVFKSQTMASLVPDQWHAEANQGFGEVDFFEAMSGKWIIEIAELQSMKGRSLEKIKQTISSTTDRYRKKYERTSIDYPRQSVFVATTNETQWLHDTSGGRRFWPLHCKSANLDYIRNTRDQLWAEAVKRFADGEKWWEMPEEETLLEQGARMIEDSWETEISVFLDKLSRDYVTTSEILRDCLGIDVGKHERAHQMRISDVLRKLGWHKPMINIRIGNKRVWKKRL